MRFVKKGDRVVVRDLATPDVFRAIVRKSSAHGFSYDISTSAHGWMKHAYEGLSWARGWNTKVARAFRTMIGLS